LRARPQSSMLVEDPAQGEGQGARNQTSFARERGAEISRHAAARIDFDVRFSQITNQITTAVLGGWPRGVPIVSMLCT
jgi:hypothetical protein